MCRTRETGHKIPTKGFWDVDSKPDLLKGRTPAQKWVGSFPCHLGLPGVPRAPPGEWGPGKDEAQFPFLQKRNVGAWAAVSVHRSLKHRLAEGDLFIAGSKSSIPRVCTLWGESLRLGLRFKVEGWPGHQVTSSWGFLQRCCTGSQLEGLCFRRTQIPVLIKVLCSKIKMPLKTQKKLN